MHATPSNIAAFNRQNGLDRPLPQQYWTWLTQVLQGNFGYSYVLNESVRSLLAQRLPKTIFLAGAATLIALLIAIPIGLLQAARRNRLDDIAVTTVVFTLYSTPAFWLAILLIEFLAVRNHIFPPEAPQGNFSAVMNNLPAMVLPVMTIALGHNRGVHALYKVGVARPAEPGLRAYGPLERGEPKPHPLRPRFA